MVPIAWGWGLDTQMALLLYQVVEDGQRHVQSWLILQEPQQIVQSAPHSSTDRCSFQEARYL